MSKTILRVTNADVVESTANVDGYDLLLYSADWLSAKLVRCFFLAGSMIQSVSVAINPIVKCLRVTVD